MIRKRYMVCRRIHENVYNCIGVLFGYSVQRVKRPFLNFVSFQGMKSFDFEIFLEVVKTVLLFQKTNCREWSNSCSLVTGPGE